MVDDGITTLETPAANRSRTRWWLGAGALGVVVAVVAAIAVVAAVRASFGDRMATASALPPETAVYLSVDLEGMARFDRVIATFDEVTEEAGMEPGTDVLDFIDEMVLGEFGLSTDDFEPWIGRDVGIAVLDLDLGVQGIASGIAPVVVAASVRDEAEADAFMPKMVAAMERQDMIVRTDSYGELALWVAEPDPDGFTVGAPVVMGRSGDMMLLATDRDALERAVDAQDGDSLREAEHFEDLVGDLPDDRALTFYLGPDALSSLTDLFSDPELGIPEQAAELEEAIAGFRGLAMALTIDDAGVRLDAVQAYAEGEEPAVGVQSGSDRIADALPADTFAYFGIGPWNVEAAWSQLQDALEAAGAMQDLALFEEELGIDVERDVVAALTGELGLGLFASPGGLFTELGGPPVGGMLLLGLADPEAAAATLDRLNRLVGDAGLAVDEDDGMFSVSPDGQNSIVYGIRGELFAVGTDGDAVRGLGGDGDRLVDGELWADTRDALDTGGPPLLFVDIGAALDAFDAPPDVRGQLAPLRAVAAAAESSGERTRATFMALIDWAEE